MKGTLVSLFLSLSAWGESLPICSNPATTFEYSITRNSSNFVFTELQSGNQITDNDGVLIAMALHRSWQSHSVDIIPSADVRLLREAMLKLKAYTPGEISRVAANDLSANAKREDTALLNARTAQVEALLTLLDSNDPSYTDIKAKTLEILGGVYWREYGAMGSRSYAVAGNPDQRDLILCQSSGRRIATCEGRNLAQYPECSGLNNKFCGKPFLKHKV